MLAGDEIVEDLARGAEAYLQMWERADGVPAQRCVQSRVTFSRARLHAHAPGRHGRSRCCAAPASPPRRPGHAWSYCAGRFAKPAGTVTPILDDDGRVVVIASTARFHKSAGIGPGARSSRLRGRAKSFGRGVFVRRAGARRAVRLRRPPRSHPLRRRRLSRGDEGPCDAAQAPAPRQAPAPWPAAKPCASPRWRARRRRSAAAARRRPAPGPDARRARRRLRRHRHEPAVRARRRLPRGGHQARPGQRLRDHLARLLGDHVDRLGQVRRVRHARRQRRRGRDHGPDRADPARPPRGTAARWR